MSGVYKRGDILQVDFGTPPNEVKGHEQGMVRRATVWKSQERLGLLIVLPVTSKKPHYALYNIIERSAARAIPAALGRPAHRI
ncbi:MAG TPA: type II toxin-antitoxin system PemK/MazF family toxin, partial [Ignavibacteriaceae bacterium]|nr:type II toxin-antitoxin system PemK/MazF family toxin [Ignavibacteriaceae bacterium]